MITVDTYCSLFVLNPLHINLHKIYFILKTLRIDARIISILKMKQLDTEVKTYPRHMLITGRVGVQRQDLGSQRHHTLNHDMLPTCANRVKKTHRAWELDLVGGYREAFQ